MKKLISLALVAALVLPACTPGGATRNDPLAGPYRVLGVKEIFADAPQYKAGDDLKVFIGKRLDWAFAPGWTIIYALAALSATFGWRDSKAQRDRSLLTILFFINALLNIAWSAVFFTLRRPDWALAEVATLWLSVAVLVVFLARFSARASLLMVPYLAWVSFAAYLNYKVVELNGPFG
jgi:tryptophan-rich sensory protein